MWAAVRPAPIRVNGMEVSKSVTEIAMDGDMLSLRWSDNTTLCGDIARLMLQVAQAECIDKLKLLAVSGFQDQTLRIDGLERGATLSVYNLQGSKVMERRVDDRHTVVDIHRLNTGIYLLKCRYIVLKFVKR